MIDFSAAPAFWGSFVRGSEDAILMARGGLDIANAPDEKGAFDLIQAHLIESLSAIGRERLDFYFLQVRTPLEEFQISGALEALEGARQEGHVQYLGLASAGAPMTTQSVWQFHDAFEVLLLQQPDSALEAMAKDRRVGIVTTYPSDYTYLQDFSGTVAEGAHA